MLVLPNYAKNYAGTIDSSLAFNTGGKFDLLHCGCFLHESLVRTGLHMDKNILDES